MSKQSHLQESVRIATVTTLSALAVTSNWFVTLPIHGKRMMTSRLVIWLGKQSVKRHFSHLAEEIGISEMTVKNVFNDDINELERTVRFETPQWMGIDEIHIIKKPRCDIANRELHTGGVRSNLWHILPREYTVFPLLSPPGAEPSGRGVYDCLCCR